MQNKIDYQAISSLLDKRSVNRSRKSLSINLFLSFFHKKIERPNLVKILYTISRIWWKCCVIARILSKHYWNQEKCQNLATTPYALRGWIFYLSVNFHLTSFCRAENPTFRGRGGRIINDTSNPFSDFWLLKSTHR